MFVAQKEPLYRRENRTTRGMKSNHGGEFSNERNGKALADRGDVARLPMTAKHRHGHDYTPLFRFLLSKVGQPWDAVQSEALSRLDSPEPLAWLVALKDEDRKDKVRVGESSYYNGLFVDDTGLLQKVAPELTAATMRPSCTCCTHTFNGKPFGLKYSSAA
jgi:hypothetical protein